VASQYTIGMDFGTNSVRALVVRLPDGEEIASYVQDYRYGNHGVIEEAGSPNLARQHPQDYVDGAEMAIRGALEAARGDAGFAPERVIGLGVDTTGSTPMPVDEEGTPLAFKSELERHPAAPAWLWKDHTSVAEAEEITSYARTVHPEYLAKCGGVYSSEWYWSKLLHCARTAPEVFAASHTWLEIADWIPAQLCGIDRPEEIKRSICAAGHKAMYNPQWGGYPEAGFLEALHPELGRIRRTLPDTCYSVQEPVGALSAAWAERSGLPRGIPVAVGAFDAHLGGVGAGIRPGVLVKNIGTSTCDVMVQPFGRPLEDIPGLCGIVPESILPGAHGLEAGQSAVGDIFNWFVSHLQPGGPEVGTHQTLSRQAAEVPAGAGGLLALDWHNGNRTILVDQRLTGMIVGLTLHSRPEEIYRALIESTAFGARTILERFEEYGVNVDEIVSCGGIPKKNPLFMQIYADVLKRPLKISRSDQTAALGSAIAGAVVAGSAAGGYDTFDDAVARMTGTLEQVYEPNPDDAAIYDELYALYRQAHDAFGGVRGDVDFSQLMKELIRIRDERR